MLRGFPPIVDERHAHADSRQLSRRGVARRDAVLRASAQPVLAAARRRDRRAARTNLPTTSACDALLAHGIGLWDVLAACHREGSLDAAIRNAQPNDFASLRAHAPKLRKVCFNGKTAGRFAPVIGAAGYATLVLPSSSPANAMLSFDQKLRLWRDILTT